MSSESANNKSKQILTNKNPERVGWLPVLSNILVEFPYLKKFEKFLKKLPSVLTKTEKSRIDWSLLPLKMNSEERDPQVIAVNAIASFLGEDLQAISSISILNAEINVKEDELRRLVLLAKAQMVIRFTWEVESLTVAPEIKSEIELLLKRVPGAYLYTEKLRRIFQETFEHSRRNVDLYYNLARAVGISKRLVELSNQDQFLGVRSSSEVVQNTLKKFPDSLDSLFRAAKGNSLGVELTEWYMPPEGELQHVEVMLSELKNALSHIRPLMEMQLLQQKGNKQLNLSRRNFLLAARQVVKIINQLGIVSNTKLVEDQEVADLLQRHLLLAEELGSNETDSSL